uniref:Uncharacterized protein n=1 Tax=Anopheles minimus TaxID=112268 RepID=A0A182WQ47_9DIPT
MCGHTMVIVYNQKNKNRSALYNGGDDKIIHSNKPSDVERGRWMVIICSLITVNQTQV